jgi:hypothetical protein
MSINEDQFELIKTIAAFGGFILGVLNFGITVYEKFGKKIKLNVEIEYSGMIQRGNELDFKIDVNLGAINGDAYLKEVYLFNKGLFNSKKLPLESLFYHESGTGTWKVYFKPPVDKIRLDKAVKSKKLYYMRDITKMVGREIIEEFINEWGSLLNADFEENIKGLKITENSLLFLTFIGGITIEEGSKNNVPNSGWYIGFDYNKGRIDKRIFENIRL